MMICNKLGAIITSLLLLSSIIISKNVMAAEQNCLKPLESEDILYLDDFKWFMTLDQIKEKELEIRASGKRLKGRAYYDKDKFVIPLEVLNKGLVNIPLPTNFIKSITVHIENAFKRGYIDALIFSDMGHSHFFIPKKFHTKHLKTLTPENYDLFYSKVFSHLDLKILYHTAEQLEMLDKEKKLINNRHLQWRFYSRNLVGDNRISSKLELLHAPKHFSNSSIYYNDDYVYSGTGFNISTSKDGCFPYKQNGKTHYFDISMKDLESLFIDDDDE